MAKTNTGLVEYAKAQLGKPYWYGTFGQVSTPELYKSKKKQYPKLYRWNYTTKELNKKVHDCVGLVKGYLWCDSPSDTTPKYNAKQDVSANGMLEKCKVKGDISTLPEVKGVLVFMNGHVGVYIGNGYVIEARGHDYGVVKTKLKNRAWKNWGYCPYIVYEKPEKKEEPKEVDNKEYYKKYTGASTKIDVVFGVIGVPEKYCGKWSKRKTVAKVNGIKAYVGTAKQNLKLVDLAKKGKLLKP
jgi:hypothetical protein